MVWCRAAPQEVNLQESRLSLPYRRRLHMAATALEEFAKTKGYTWAQLSRPIAANGVLMEFIQVLWDHQGSFSLAKHSVLSVQTAFPAGRDADI